MNKVTVDIHNYPSEIGLDDVAEMVKDLAKKYEELEEENEQLREIVEEHKQKRFR